MKRRYSKQRIQAEINITPFTDVILVLLIIFMIATPLLLESNIHIKLPETSSAPEIKSGDQVYITITDESLVYLDKELVTRKELKDKVAVLQSQKPEIKVLFREAAVAIAGAWYVQQDSGAPMSSDTLKVAEMTVDEIMARSPATMPVLNAFGVDNCCGAHSTVHEAAVRDGVDETALIAALELAMQEPK